MKRLCTLLLLLVIVCSCDEKKEEPTFTISGNSGMPESTVYLCGLDSRHNVLDSALCDNSGKFTISIPFDTVVPLALLTPDGHLLPVYAESKGEATLKRDSTLRCGWRVDAGKTQELYNIITRRLDKCTDMKETIEIIDSFFAAYPVSEVNVEILRQYIVDVPSPDNKEIRSRINKLGGKLQDHEYPTRIKKITDNTCSNILHRSFPNFNYTTVEGKDIALSTYIRKYTLVTFWASWDKTSREHMKKLALIDDSVKSESFAILNISLDYDTAQWKKFITEDSIAGDNVNDIKTMNSDLLKKFNIKSLPHTMLVSPYQRVMEYDVDLGNIAGRIDSLSARYDKEQQRKKEKEEKERKQKNKKK